VRAKDKIYHTRESIINRLSEGPAVFREFAFSRNHKHGSRVQARQIIDELTDEGVIKQVFVGRYRYIVMNNDDAMEDLYRLQIEESSKPSPCGCIHWTGFIDKERGPTLRIAGEKNVKSSVRRYLWKEYKGNIGVNDIIKVSCNDDSCVNISHMYKTKRNQSQKNKPKTLTARMKMAESMRRIVGKLNADKAEFIRSSNLVNKELAEMFGVSQSNISAIKRGVIWKDLSPSPFAGLMK
jgi:predicted XRE-type DNA-binding protein